MKGAETVPTPLHFGLLGASNIAASRMLPAFAAAGIGVSGVYDSEERRFRYWQDFGVGPLTTDLDEVLGSDVDAVYISSRNDQHARQAIAAAEAGKHILVEKPIALTVADAKAMIAAADRHGVLLAVNHHLPGSPLHATTRRLVQEGRIGTILSARINHAVLLPEHLRGWRLSDAPGAGVIMDITVHDASVLNPLFGTRPVHVSAIAVRQAGWNTGGTEDAVMTVIEYAPDGAGPPRLAQTHDAFTVPGLSTYLEVHGDRGSIVVGDAMTQDTPGTVSVHDPDGIESVEVDCSADLYSIILESFVAGLRGDGKPTATGEDGLWALRVALAAAESTRTGRTVALDNADTDTGSR
jgi:1,5-anhydro-D-fructose reductase (1,5-anhydro-D-mannitol-forming)